MTKKVLLKNIPAEQWDKIKVSTPELAKICLDVSKARDENADNNLEALLVSRKMKFTYSWHEKEEGLTDSVETYYRFTDLGAEKIKSFADSSFLEKHKWRFETGADSQVEGLEKMSEDLEAITIKQGKFTSQKAFEFVAWALGDQEVEIDQQETESEVQELEAKMKEASLEEEGVRNILLIGSTGNGKSTLANVLVNNINVNDIDENSKFKEVFKESDSSVSVTKEFQAEVVEVKDEKGNIIKYRIIDTIGIGDTQLTVKEVLRRIANAAHMVKGGLHQVLFVAGGRFTEQEREAYDLLRAVIFDPKISLYTTIVRTKFTKFDKLEIREKDKKDLMAENKEMAEIIETCRGIIYVSNPPVDDEDEYMRIGGLRTRAKSRKVVLDHLYFCDGVYKPKNLDELNERIGGYMSEKEKLMKRLEEERNLSAADRENLARKIEDLTEKITGQTAQVVEQKGVWRKLGSWTGKQADKIVDKCTPF